MNSAELLADAFGRIRDGVHNAVDGLSTKTSQPDSTVRPTRSRGSYGT